MCIVCFHISGGLFVFNGKLQDCGKLLERLQWVKEADSAEERGGQAGSESPTSRSSKEGSCRNQGGV